MMINDGFLTPALSGSCGVFPDLLCFHQSRVPLGMFVQLPPWRMVHSPGIGFIDTDIITGIPAFFSHFVTNLPAFHLELIFVSLKPLPLPYMAPEQQFLIGQVGSREHSIFRCIVRCGYHDHVRDTYDFEDKIIGSNGEFISLEKHGSEDLNSADGRMLVVGNVCCDGNALVVASPSCSVNIEQENGSRVATTAPKKRKKVRFALPLEDSPNMDVSMREELKKLVDTRESGSTYIGKSHICGAERL